MRFIYFLIYNPICIYILCLYVYTYTVPAMWRSWSNDYSHISHYHQLPQVQNIHLLTIPQGRLHIIYTHASIYNYKIKWRLLYMLYYKSYIIHLPQLDIRDWHYTIYLFIHRYYTYHFLFCPNIGKMFSNRFELLSACKNVHEK